MSCLHGINIMNHRCDRCEEIAKAEHRQRRRVTPSDNATPDKSARGAEKWTVQGSGNCKSLVDGKGNTLANYYGISGAEIATNISNAHNASLSLAEARAQESEQTIARLVTVKDRACQAAAENKAEADALRAQLAEAERKLRETTL